MQVIVVEMDIVKGDCVGGCLQWSCIRCVLDFYMLLFEGEQLFNIGQCLMNFMVKYIEEVQWNVELDEEGIDQYDIVNSYLVICYVECGLLYY